MEQKRNTHEQKSEPKQKSSEEASSSAENGGNADVETEADITNKTFEDDETVSNTIDQDAEAPAKVAQKPGKSETAKAVPEEADDAVA